MNTESVNKALEEFGVPTERAEKPAPKQRPFLEALSGRDPLRVMRAGQANGGHDWLPYAWAR